VLVIACEQALLGPLEQQEVCVAKAGLVASLPARTSLLAAANPAGGQYNRAKTLLQNLKMSAAMLSRFDIIFVLLDQPDQRRDERLSEHVMAMHSGRVSSRDSDCIVFGPWLAYCTWHTLMVLAYV
jgi:DNA helicase MCM8